MMKLDIKNINCNENITYLKRIIHDDLDILDAQLHALQPGIKIHIISALHPNNNEIIEENAYLNFYPFDDDKKYLQLTFVLENLPEKSPIIQIVQILYYPEFFYIWKKDLLNAKDPFLYDRSAEQTFTLTPSYKTAIPQIIKICNEESNLQNEVEKFEIALRLFRSSIESYFLPCEANTLPACSFLNSSAERDKVFEARETILKRLNNPITIKDLSKIVGMNECYLKKGFKAMFGKTIHEFQQFERIEKAKSLIKQNKYNINEVAYMMGFNSHTHFSTAFKRVTGLKPCELLG
ncbi:MAG TPA: AraC family transcriptional regulator [Chitinophagaceae bacterium]|nr:AraC family transcriptional regulator [Chitinophagaceae bacterium]